MSLKVQRHRASGDTATTPSTVASVRNAQLRSIVTSKSSSDVDSATLFTIGHVSLQLKFQLFILIPNTLQVH